MKLQVVKYSRCFSALPLPPEHVALHAEGFFGGNMGVSSMEHLVQLLGRAAFVLGKQTCHSIKYSSHSPQPLRRRELMYKHQRFLRSFPGGLSSNAHGGN